MIEARVASACTEHSGGVHWFCWLQGSDRNVAVAELRCCDCLLLKYVPAAVQDVFIQC